MTPGDRVLMDDGLVHVIRRIAGYDYRVWCEDVIVFNLDDNGAIVLEPVTCIECATKGKTHGH